MDFHQYTTLRPFCWETLPLGIHLAIDLFLSLFVIGTYETTIAPKLQGIPIAAILSNNSRVSGKRWSIGCILIDSTEIDEFAQIVGSEGVLIVRR